MKIATYVLLGLLLLLQYPLWFGGGGVISVWRLNREIAAQQQENARLRERNLALEAEVNDLKQGLAAIEGRARSELGMVKKGETFYQVIDPASSDINPSLSSKSKTPK
ncbi:MAG: cell division protein FtsB [Gammaproteobacteria bacterium]|nr:cell division protein FtsB [Gammaproteobacteria bacterium]